MSSTIRGSYDVIVEELVISTRVVFRFEFIATLCDCGIHPS